MKKRKKLNAVEENEKFEFVKGFFSRYVDNLSDIRGSKQKWILKGDSPFADGDILIGEKLNWYCEATKQSGDEIDFLRKESPLLTDQGANAVVIEECAQTKDWHGVTILDQKSFKKELKLFRESVVNNDSLNASEKAKFLTNNIWVNDAGEFHYMELSRTNAPLCRYHWGDGDAAFGLFFLECGVSRIKEHPDASTIYFVENPLQLITLKEYVDDPIYVKPDNLTYFDNDYFRMVQGKEIVFCSTDKLFYCTFDDLQLDRYDKNDTDTVISLLKSPRKY